MYGPIFVATATQRGEGMTPYVHITIIPGPVSAVSGVKHKQSDAQPSSQHQACILSMYTLPTVAGYHDRAN